MKKILNIALLALSAVLVSCGGKDTKLVTFNVATRTGVDTGLAYKTVVMPISGTKLIMNTDIVLYSGDISEIHVAENTMPTGEKIPGFFVYFSGRAKNKLTNVTASNIGSYIVMMYDGKPIGLRIIDTVITDGRLFVCSEYGEDFDSMHKLAAEMMNSVKDVNEMKKN